MGKSATTGIMTLIEAAQAEKSCLAANSHEDARQLRRRLSKGLIEPLPHLFADAAYWESLDSEDKTLHLMRGAATAHPSWVFCDVSAAAAHGMPLWWARLDTIHLWRPTGGRKCLPANVMLHHATRHTGDEVQTVNGCRVTSLWRTAFDCMATLPFPEALAIADYLARTLQLSGAGISSELRRRFAGCPGIRRAAKIALAADPRPDNGGESMARGTMMQQGFVPPELQVHIPNPLDPERDFIVDFLWLPPWGTIVGELDGVQKTENPTYMGSYDAREILRRERMRESRLTLYGIPIARFAFHDVTHPDALAIILDRYGVPKRGGLPATPPTPNLRPIESRLLWIGGWTVVATTLDPDAPKGQAPSAA